MYKQQHGLGDWDSFMEAVELRFGAYDYRKHLLALLAVKQEGSMEELG